MKKTNPGKWLLLIHQMPPKPDSLRVKIWRRLQQVGAVAVKQSVYILPLSDQAREDFAWILKEIVAGGGDASISEARFMEGLNDDQIVTYFQNARKADYEKIINEAAELRAGMPEIHDASDSAPVKQQLARLQRGMKEIQAIDFFSAPERFMAENTLEEVRVLISEPRPVPGASDLSIAALKGKTWVTRRNIFIDRIASGWLVRWFIDSNAKFKFVGGKKYSPLDGEIRFDMFNAEFTHEGDLCTFEALIKRLGLDDMALTSIAEIVHDIDLKDSKYNCPETAGITALVSGLAASRADDNERMERGGMIFDQLYTHFKRHKGK